MRLNLYNGKEQSEHIDEGVERIMAKQGWEQSFSAELTRLAFGYLAVAVALYVWHLEKTVPFRESRLIVGVLCAVYFSLTWGAWLWQRYVEKGSMYIGTKDGAKVWIATNNPKNTPTYEATVTLKTQDGNYRMAKYSLSIPNIVDTNGVVHEEKLSDLLEILSEESKKTR